MTTALRMDNDDDLFVVVVTNEIPNDTENNMSGVNALYTLVCKDESSIKRLAWEPADWGSGKQ